jgi:beta-lactam-binding protein with PASTA domain
VWNTLAAAVKGTKAQDFPKPKETTVFGKQRSIPDVMCSSVAAATAELTGAGFAVRVDDVKVPSRCAAGTVGEVEPSRQTVQGGVVRLRVSSGAQSPPSPSGPAVPPPPG